MALNRNEASVQPRIYVALKIIALIIPSKLFEYSLRLSGTTRLLFKRNRTGLISLHCARPETRKKQV